MADTVVNVILKAQNQTANAFRTLGTQFNAFKTSVGQATKAAGSGLAGALANAGTAANNAAQNGVSAFDLLNNKLLLIAGTAAVVGLAFAKLSSEIGKGIEREVENLNTVNTAINTLGLSEDKASIFVQRFNKDVAILGRDLPTTSENIVKISRTIIDDYAEAYKKAGRSTDQIRDTLLKSSSKIALSAELSNTNLGVTQAAIQAYLSGGIAGERGLSTYQFFGNNTALRNALKEGLKTSGKKGFGDLSAFERIELLNKALDKALPQSAINRLQSTSKAKISSFMDSLFDPEIGIFSLTRDLDNNTLNGYQSVYTSFQTTLDLIIGERGLLAQFARLFGLVGTDPMKDFKIAVDVFNAYISGFVITISGLGKGQSQALGIATGKFLATLANNILDGILAATAKINYGAILTGLVSGLASFFANLDWKFYAIGSAVALGAFLFPVVTGVLATVGGIIVSGIVAIAGGIPLALGAAIVLGVVALTKLFYDNWDSITATWKTEFANLGTFLQSIPGFIKQDFEPVFAFYQQEWNTITTFLSEKFNSLLAFYKSDWDNLVKLVSDTGKSITEGAQNAFNAIRTGIQTAIDAVNQLIDSVIKPIQGFVTGATNNLQGVLGNTNPTSSISTGISVASTAARVTGNPAANIIGSVGNFVSGLFGSARYQGQISTAANGFIPALAVETQRKPVNSDLVIANTSETILRKNQLDNLINNTYTRGQKSAVNVNFGQGSILLQISGDNPQNIAEQVIQVLENRLANELEARLA
ncbi:MAG: hypothetical protein KME30_17195 [Iphinoe sp. HA4291-MV1]|jgi:hypothetical protein|nr:hypothetical protein [Iphinoe sp. HA4291-MV1]